MWCVCVCVASEPSCVSKYPKSPKNTKVMAGRLPLRRHHGATAGGNHSLASPPALESHGETHGETLETHGKSTAKVELNDLPRTAASGSTSSTSEARNCGKGSNLLSCTRSHRKLSVDWNHVWGNSKGTMEGNCSDLLRRCFCRAFSNFGDSQSGSSYGGGGVAKWPFQSNFAS